MPDFQTLETERFDVIVIGGGINGAGVARDAAMRGLRTIAIEKGDFGGATTGWSTRLIHGGLRYLEYLEFPLVRESLREREILLRNAPHLVKPIQFTVPLYRDRPHTPTTIKLGMWLYDLLSFDKSLPSHRILSTAQCRHLFPALDPVNLTGAAQYYDAQVEYAERLCLEVVQAAELAGATVLNYTEVVELQQENGFISKLTCRDTLTDRVFSLLAGPHTVVVNTAGPWLDRVCERGTEAGDAKPLSDRRLVGGTKGSHLFVRQFPGAPSSGLYVEAAQDGRPYFIVPWLGGFLIGTTDLRCDDDLDGIKASAEEIDYLIEATNRVLPMAQLAREDVQFSYAGVRPLPNSVGKSAGAITRKHVVVDFAKQGGVGNLIALVGGKLTTHRNSSQELVDEVFSKLGKSSPPCQTAITPLPGAITSDSPVKLATLKRYRDHVSPLTVEHLFTLYGSKAAAVLELGDKEPELFEPIISGLPDIKAQIIYAVRHEYARTLTDIAHRRTSLSALDGYGFEAVKAIADVLIRFSDWDQTVCQSQLTEHLSYMQKNYIPDFQNTSPPATLGSERIGKPI